MDRPVRSCRRQPQISGGKSSFSWALPGMLHPPMPLNKLKELCICRTGVPPVSNSNRKNASAAPRHCDSGFQARIAGLIERQLLQAHSCRMMNGGNEDGDRRDACPTPRLPRRTLRLGSFGCHFDRLLRVRAPALQPDCIATDYSPIFNNSTLMMSGLPFLIAATRSAPGSRSSWMRQLAATAPSRMMF